MGQATAFQRLVTARVKLLFEDRAFGSRITLLIPVEVENLGALATDGTHLMFNPVYIRTAVRSDVHARLKEIAAALPDPVVAPREAFAPWTGRLVDGVLRVDQPSEETLHALDRLDAFLARQAPADDHHHHHQQHQHHGDDDLRHAGDGGHHHHHHHGDDDHRRAGDDCVPAWKKDPLSGVIGA
jgi:hypothetical protein